MNRAEEAIKVSHNLLRQTTSFVGREQDILDISLRLSNPLCQLLTLVGAGGVGKTRLALEILLHTYSSYRDGAYFVPLQPLRSPADIPMSIIQAMGLVLRDRNEPLPTLIDYLHGRQVLLVLDNFEHLIEGAALVTTILTQAADVRILVTSRESLKLHEEWQWNVKGLSFPSGEEGQEQGTETYSALDLFAERAAQVNPQFSIQAHSAAVTRICQLLEGIPLAIEMAANWTKLLSADAIADAIEHNLDFLTSREQNIPERHRSMRAVYNHSWRLLFEAERQVFQKLSVFHGGFTLEAAEQVAGATLETLASLTDKSFLRQDADGRYSIHELLRQYGAEQLAQFEGTTTVINCYVAYFADLVKDCEPDLKREAQLLALDKIEADFENIRAAWSYAVTHFHYEQVDQMIDSLYWFGEMRSFSLDVRAFFVMAADALAPAIDEEPHPVWARLAVRIRQSDDVDIIERAMTIAENHGKQAEVAYCLMQRGIYATEYRQAHALNDLHKALEIYQNIGDDFGVAVTHLDINYYHGFFASIDTMMKHLDLAVQHARKMGNPYHRYKTLFRRAWTYCSDGQYALGEHDFREALEIANQMGFRELGASCIGSLGVLASFRGDFQQAKQMAIQNLEGVMRLADVGEQGFAKITLSSMASMEGKYAEALELAEQALILVKPNLMRQRSVSRVMAIAHYGLGNFDKAWECARWAMAEEHSTGILIWNMPIFALLVAHDGDTNAAAELLGLIFTHHASPLGWFENWDLLHQLRTQLTEELGAEAFAKAWERGTTLELELVVHDLLMMTSEAASQPLVEPLTDRELEVLQLVAEGLSNHEIAESMTVVEGTIRTHVYNLSQKLGVRNRTSAVARARALHILR